MKKTMLRQIVDASYKDDELDAKTVEKIASLLKRKELREYIKALKNRERTRYVIITGASDVSLHKADLAKKFPNKKLVFQTDPSLLVGMQIVDNDTLYEVSLRNTLDQLERYMNE